MTRSFSVARGASLSLLCAVLVMGLAQPSSAADIKSILGPPRLDLSFTAGVESNDPFIKRRGIGGRVRLMPIRAAGLDVMFVAMPNLQLNDYTELTLRFYDENGVVADISRATSAFQVSAVIAPLLGKLPGPKGQPPVEFDWYFTVGAGFVNTEDDAKIISMEQCIGEAYLENINNDCWYLKQTHPAWSMGMGLRGIFGGGLVVGLEMRSINYTEQVFSDETVIDSETGAEILDPLTGEPADYRSEDRSMLWWSLSIGGSIPMLKP